MTKEEVIKFLEGIEDVTLYSGPSGNLNGGVGDSDQFDVKESALKVYCGSGGKKSTKYKYKDLDEEKLEKLLKFLGSTCKKIE